MKYVTLNLAGIVDIVILGDCHRAYGTVGKQEIGPIVVAVTPANVALLAVGGAGLRLLVRAWVDGLVVAEPAAWAGGRDQRRITSHASVALVGLFLVLK